MRKGTVDVGLFAKTTSLVAKIEWYRIGITQRTMFLAEGLIAVTVTSVTLIFTTRGNTK